MKNRTLKNIDEAQLRQLDEYRRGIRHNNIEPSIYIGLLDLVDHSDISETFMILHNVACDLGCKAELEAMYEGSKEWKWDETSS